VTGDKFSIEDLVSKTLKINKEETTEWFKHKNVVLPKPDFLSEIKQPQIYPSELLIKIEPNHEYVMSRGISENVAKKFEGGVVRSGKLKDRYVWPIFNARKQVVGFTGRDLTGKKKNKYLHFGMVSTWCWPCFLNKDLIKDSVILVESPMDVMSLFECGIENVVCLFGTELKLGLLNLFLRLNTNKIIISTNSDTKHSVGQEAAEKIKNRLLKYFDKENVEIRLPFQKDFNECLMSGEKERIIKTYG
jgi:DNA primase